MKDYVLDNEDVIAVFAALNSFRDHVPEERSVETGISACESRKKCVRLMETNNRFMMVDNVSSCSMFPLKDIFDSVEDADVESLTNRVSSIYVGTPSK
jgi:hypothetical protein